jgi:hypothetical protein
MFLVRVGGRGDVRCEASHYFPWFHTVALSFVPAAFADSEHARRFWVSRARTAVADERPSRPVAPPPSRRFNETLDVNLGARYCTSCIYSA